jgi:hypothetical protein
MNDTTTHTKPRIQLARTEAELLQSSLIILRKLSEQAGLLYNHEPLAILAPEHDYVSKKAQLHFTNWTPGSDHRMPALFARVTGTVNGKTYTMPISLTASARVGGISVWARGSYSEPITESARFIIIAAAYDFLNEQGVTVDDIRVWGTVAAARSALGDVLSTVAHIRTYEAENDIQQALNVTGSL